MKSALNVVPAGGGATEGQPGNSILVWRLTWVTQGHRSPEETGEEETPEEKQLPGIGSPSLVDRIPLEGKSTEF